MGAPPRYFNFKSQWTAPRNRGTKPGPVPLKDSLRDWKKAGGGALLPARREGDTGKEEARYTPLPCHLSAGTQGLTFFLFPKLSTHSFHQVVLA